MKPLFMYTFTGITMVMSANLGRKWKESSDDIFGQICPLMCYLVCHSDSLNMEDVYRFFALKYSMKVSKVQD